MAGRGQRFRDAGYDVAKFAIEVHGRTLFAWSLISLTSWLAGDTKVVFVTRREDDASRFVSAQCELLKVRSFEVVELDQTTDGQATTVLAAEPMVADIGAGLLIYNIDTHVRPDALDASRVHGDGWLPCFPGLGSAWSFALADAHGRVTDVREKQRISGDATIGLYWFASFARYRSLYDRADWHRRPGQAGERYIAPLYGDLLKHGGEVFIERLPADAVIPLGTPSEVAAFAAGPEPQGAPYR